jgi:LCP family protein required for cell wall assembly
VEHRRLPNVGRTLPPHRAARREAATRDPTTVPEAAETDILPGVSPAAPNVGSKQPAWRGPSASPVSDGFRRKVRGRRWRRVALIAGLAVLLVVAGVGLVGWRYAKSIEKSVGHVDAFRALPEEERPTNAAPKAMNILLLGSDSRDPELSGSRADTIIVVHLSANRERAQLISIPRDTWTTVPTSTDGTNGGSTAKINAAYAWGGTPLMVRAVENFTGVRMDHVLVVDFAGFKEIVDALDGIDLVIDHTFTSIHPPFRTFTAGPARLDGAAALDYSRQRKQFADGDFTRIRHQQQVIEAMLDKATERSLMTDPRRLNEFLQATANTVRVDESLSLFDLVRQLRHLHGSDISPLTSPSSGMGMVGTESVVFPDTARATGLYEAVRNDTMDQWLTDNQ